MIDILVVLALVAVAVVGAEVVRRTCRRQLTRLAVLPVDQPAAPATAATPAVIGTAEAD